MSYSRSNNLDNESKSSSDEPARQAALTILSGLLSSPAYLPASLKSREVIRRHMILDLTPDDTEDYLVTDCYPSTYKSTPAKCIELLRMLNVQVEQLQADDGAGCASGIIGQIRYRSAEPDCMLIAVDLGRPALLTLLLRLEGPEDDRESYKYDNLLPCDVVPSGWHSGIEDARRTSLYMLASQQPHGSAHRGQATRQQACASHPRESDGSDCSKVVHEQEDEAANEAPGDYYTDPNDFWAGVDSDEDSLNSGKRSEHTVELSAQQGPREEAEEARYWAWYDQQGSQIGDQASEMGNANEHSSRYDVQQLATVTHRLPDPPGKNGLSNVNVAKSHRSMMAAVHNNQGNSSSLSDGITTSMNEGQIDKSDARHDREAPDRAIEQRNNAVKLILKGAWQLMAQRPAACGGQTSEWHEQQADEFLTLAREAIISESAVRESG